MARNFLCVHAPSFEPNPLAATWQMFFSFFPQQIALILSHFLITVVDISQDWSRSRFATRDNSEYKSCQVVRRRVHWAYLVMSGFRRRLMFKRSWVWILAPALNNFSNVFAVKNVLLFEMTENKQKRLGIAHLKTYLASVTRYREKVEWLAE